MPGVFKRMPISKCEGAHHERNLSGLPYRLRLSLTRLGAEVRDDLVVAGHDRVLGTHPVRFATVDVSDIDILTVGRILRSHHGTIETNFDLIIRSV